VDAKLDPTNTNILHVKLAPQGYEYAIQLPHAVAAEFAVEITPFKVEFSLLRTTTKVEQTAPEPKETKTDNKKTKDWSKVEHEADEYDKHQENKDLDSMFKNIYGSADSDSRRAMIKSYEESGGTVLNMNWGEVSKTDYRAKLKEEQQQQQKKSTL